MGNGNRTKDFGKGKVELQFISRKKLVLLNVFHVPEIRKNLILTNLLCEKELKIVLEFNKVVISKNGVFVGERYSCDVMFKLDINNYKNVPTYIVDPSIIIWHSREGHVNFNSLNYMSRHELISCSSSISDKYEICVKTKMHTKSFYFVERA